MFRSKKRRQQQRSQVRRSTRESEDEEEEDSVAVVVVRKKKSHRKLIKSGGGHNTKKKQQQQPSTIGLEEAEEESSERNAGDTSFYGKDGLAQLLKEQSSYQQKPVVSETKPLANPTAPPPTLGTRPSQLSEQRKSEEDFIALDGGTTVLSGEEALKFTNQQHTLLGGEDDDDPTSLHQELPHNDDDNREARVTHRAGLSARPTTNSIPSSLGSLRDHVQRSLQQNQSQQAVLAERMRKRRHEMTCTPLQHHQTQLEHAGKQLEAWQRLRHDLCAWTGAMRDLHTRIDTVLWDALCPLQEEWACVEQERQGEDIMVHTLQEHAALEQVLGRQPHRQQQQQADTATMDEFGRSLKSRHVLQREKQRMRRRKIREQKRRRMNTDEEDEDALSDADLSDGEQEKLQQRYEALQMATTVSLNELESHYTDLQNLFRVFQEWHATYPAEYEQCYASLSLADLASVFVKVELCSHDSLWSASLCDNDVDSTAVHFRWITAMQEALSLQFMDAAGVDRLLEKAILPLMDNLLVDRKGINLLSKRQVNSLSQLMSQLRVLEKSLPVSSAMMESIQAKIRSYVKQQLDAMAIPILAENHATASNNEEELAEALRQATRGQLCHMAKMITNSVLLVQSDDDEFVGIVLEFVGNRFLFVVSALLRGNSNNDNNSIVRLLRTLHKDVLVPTGWLEQPQWMLQAAPIRAVMATYCPS